MNNPVVDFGDAVLLPNDGELKRVSQLAQRQLELEAEVAAQEEKLKQLNAQLKQLREREIPEVMGSVGLSKFTMTGGATLQLKTDVVASIPVAQREKAFSWLEAHGHGAVIKHEVKISFGKGEDAWAKKFMMDMAKRKKPLNAERKDTVHAQTLGALVRDMLAQGVDVPMDLLGVYKITYSKITREKDKAEF